MIVLVDRERILDAWRESEHLVQKALDHSIGEFDKFDILRFLLTQEMQLWLAVDGEQIKGITVTQLIHFPRYKAMQVVLMAGKDAFNGWFREMMAAVETHARVMGAKKIQECGREGWERMERRLNLGFKKAYTVMVKEL